MLSRLFKKFNQRIEKLEKKTDGIRDGYTLTYRLCKKCGRKTLQMEINDNRVYDCCICDTRWVLADTEVKL
ncbi:hypothetical protein LCGC14_2044790 [marine sediment metagenome]|uniref:Uncharacterized protein n=1 Tax=marine sediment metagenome TaxID=412755 RepID=A0A0F9EQQ0_9ZZZZ